MKVLVTGGAGFVGSQLTWKLSELKHNVTVIDDFSTGKKEYTKGLKRNNVKIIKQDILNLKSGLDKFDVVFHLAAKPFSKSKADWFSESNEIFQTNAVGTYNVLRLTKSGCHFIFVSSASIYGEGRKMPETSLHRPKSAYGYSKTIAEEIVTRSNRWRTILRPATIIGPRGKCFPNRVMWSLANNEKCTFFKDGAVLRDIIDVRDVVSSLIKVMENKVTGVYNLGTNVEITGKKLASYAKNLAEQKQLSFQYEFTPFAPDDFVTVSTLHSDKLWEVLKSKPMFTLAETLREILGYYQHSTEAKEPPSWESL